jgi:hypothetical protein
MRRLANILYVGQFEPYMKDDIVPTVASRFDGLRRLGLNVVHFDSSEFKGDGLWTRRFNQRLYLGSSVRRLNRELVQVARAQKPDVVWVDKGYWMYPDTLARLKQSSQYLVHYNTDDIFGKQSFAWLHRRGLRYYDVCLTTNRRNVHEIRDHYGIRAMRAGMGFDLRVHDRERARARPVASSGGIIFIGHWEPHSEAFIQALTDAGCPVHIWGARWRYASNRAFRSTCILAGETYVSTIAGADIALCFLSRKNRNESTGRSFEIPAIGSFMLAERTPEHEYLYGDGSGAALFSGRDELIAKARYYLHHPQERSEIAAAGHIGCQLMGLSWQQHIAREWSLIEELLQSPAGIPDRPEADAPFWPGFRIGRLPSPTDRCSSAKTDGRDRITAGCS